MGPAPPSVLAIAPNQLALWGYPTTVLIKQPPSNSTAAQQQHNYPATAKTTQSKFKSIIAQKPVNKITHTTINGLTAQLLLLSIEIYILQSTILQRHLLFPSSILYKLQI